MLYISVPHGGQEIKQPFKVVLRRPRSCRPACIGGRNRGREFQPIDRVLVFAPIDGVSVSSFEWSKGIDWRLIGD
jgi:hypothetical protein